MIVKFPPEKSIEAEAVKSEFTVKLVSAHDISLTFVVDSKASNVKVYKLEIPSTPMALLMTAAVGPQFAKAN